MGLHAIRHLPPFAPCFLTLIAASSMHDDDDVCLDTVINTASTPVM
jgi:hypothetical protein